MKLRLAFGHALCRLACGAWLCMAAGVLPVRAATPEAAPAVETGCRPAADALVKRGAQSVNAGRYQEAVAPFEQALRLCRVAADRPGISAALLEYGSVLQLLNRFAESESALLEGWTLRQQIDSGPAPDGDPERERMYYPAELMYLYRQWSRYDLAWEWGEKALRAKAQLVGTDASSYGTSLSNMSGIALVTRDYARGLPYARGAMGIWERTSGTDSTDHAWGMRDVGALLFGQGKMQEAYHYLERAYRIRLAAFGQDSTETQTSTEDLAAWHTQAGNDAAALDFAELALDSAVRRFGPEALGTSYALARVARIHLRLGEAAQAADEAERVLRIRRGALGEQAAQTVNAWQDVAKTQLANNRLGRSVDAAQAAFRACQAIPGGVAASCVAHQLDHARALLALGQAGEALAQARQVAALARKHGEMGGDEQGALMLVAQALRALGRQAEAEDALVELAQRVAVLADPVANGQLEVALALDAVRAERTGIGAADLAVLAGSSSATAQRVGERRGWSHPVHASALLDAAALNARGPDPALARAQSARALAIGVANRATLLQARAAAQLSELDNGAQVVFLGKLAVNALQAARENTTGLPVEQQHSFLRLKKSAYQRLADQLLNQQRIGEAERVLALVEANEFHDLVRGAGAVKGGRHDARVARLRFDGVDEAAEREFALRARGLEQAAQALAQARAREAQGSPGGQAALAAAQADLHVLLDEATAAWGAPTLPAGVTLAGADATPDATSTAPDHAALRPGRLHLTYLVGERHIRLVAQHGSIARVLTLDVDEAGLARDIALLRSLAQDPGKDPRLQAQRLFRQLLGPVLPELTRARTLTLSLGGVLRYLPFAMLHDGRQWLVERLPLQVAGSAGTDHVAGPATVPPRPKSVALLGQSQASGDLPALPFVARELQAVGAIGKAGSIPSHTYLDAGFTAASLERALQSNSMVHIASHFVLRPGRDDGSYLVLGRGEQLSLAELAQPRFRFAGLDLLTLSACETAVPAGIDATGRELAGLAWLARERGARHVLASLWRVSDRSTATLMADFYRALGGGAGKAEALRLAQVRQLRRTAPPEQRRSRGLKAIDGHALAPSYGHPYYWAGFTLLGP